MRTHPNDTLPATEEILSLTLQHGIHIVIKIQEFLIQVLYSMQKHLNRRTVECGKEFLRNNIPMQNDVYLLAINPCRHLTVMRDHKMHLANEGHVHGYTTKQIRQCTPIAKTLLKHWLIGVPLIILLPHRIKPIHICNDNIHYTEFNYDKNSARREKKQIYL